MKVFNTFEDVFNWIKTYKTFGWKSYQRLGNFLKYEPATNGLEIREVLKSDPAKMETVDKILNIISHMYTALCGKSPYAKEKCFKLKVKRDLYYLVYTVQGIILG